MSHDEDETVSTTSRFELSEVLRPLTDEMSHLRVAKTLVTAKTIYEDLHPEARHGGDRIRRIPVPGFAKYVAARTGMKKRTVERRVLQGELLKSLDPEAERKAFGTPVANLLGLLVRVAALPASEHVEVVSRLANNLRNGTRLLKYMEEEHGIIQPKLGKQAEARESTCGGQGDDGLASDDGVFTKRQSKVLIDDEPDSSEGEDVVSRGAQPGEGNVEVQHEPVIREGVTRAHVSMCKAEPFADPEDAAQQLQTIMDVLGVDHPDECISQLKELFDLLEATDIEDAILNLKETGYAA